MAAVAASVGATCLRVGISTTEMWTVAAGLVDEGALVLRRGVHLILTLGEDFVAAAVGRGGSMLAGGALRGGRGPFAWLARETSGSDLFFSRVFRRCLGFVHSDGRRDDERWE